MSQEKQKSSTSQIPGPPLAPLDVPAFPCIVHVRIDGGNYRGNVANLAGIEAIGSSERELLGKIVPMFKRVVGGFHQRGEAIPWITPVPAPEPAETKRFIPVHL